jgi:hypothetical protein
LDAETGAPGWGALTDTLDLWAAEGRTARLWWRDDDAGEAVPALLRLLNLGEDCGIDLALAVVPAAAEAPLAEAMDGHSRVTVAQHGWAHRNHGPAGQPAVEVGGTRAVADVLRELADGRERLTSLFGARFAPILVPPWNRIEASVLPHLVEAGYRGLSTFGTRGLPEPEPGLVTVNTHIDILRWRGGGHFAGADKVLRQLVGHMRDRIDRAGDKDEPIGLLTHHRDHDGQAWAFLDRLLRTTRDHPAACWLSVEQAFARRGDSSSGPDGAA